MERKRTNSNREMASARQMLVRSVLQWAPEQGLQDTALHGVGLVRSDGPTNFMPTVYEPSLIFVVQGRKTVQLGDEGITYDPLSYLATSVHLPVMGQVVEASPKHPYLAIRLAVETREVTDLVLEFQLPAEFSFISGGLFEGTGDWECSAAGSVVTCEMDTGLLPVGADAAIISVDVQVASSAASGTVQTTATITGANNTDPDPGSNTDSVDTNITELPAAIFADGFED